MNESNIEKVSGLNNRAPDSAIILQRAWENDILTITTKGGPAAVAFHELAVKKRNGDLEEHHAQFIVVTDKDLISNTQGFDSESASDNEVSIYCGVFRLNFDCTPLSKGDKWVLGKGVGEKIRSRNVEILLAAPGSRHRKHLTSAHAFLRMNMASGAWILHAGEGHHINDLNPIASTNSPNGFEQCRHKPVVLNDEFMEHGSMQC